MKKKKKLFFSYFEILITQMLLFERYWVSKVVLAIFQTPVKV